MCMLSFCDAVFYVSRFPMSQVELEVYSISADKARMMDTYSAYEFQRFEPIVGWGNDSPGHLLPTDPGRWCSGDGKKWSLSFDDVVPPMPEGYVETAPWSVFFGEENDADGWEYGVDFNSHNWHSSQSKLTFARRRMYTREVIGTVPPTSALSNEPITDIETTNVA